MKQQTLTAINIAIAESLRWKRRAWVDKKGRSCSGWRTPDGKELGGHPPNYTADQNACHEFMETLTDDQIVIFTRHLQAITKPQLGTPHFRKKWWSNFMRATARQRCEAYLRTIGKWKEEFNS